MKEEELVRKTLPSLLDNRLDSVPYAEELTIDLKKQVFVKQTIIEQRSSLVPVADHHHEEGATLGSRRGDAHGIV